MTIYVLKDYLKNINQQLQLQMADTRDREDDGDQGEDPNYDPEAEVVGNWKRVDLPQVPVVTGEEDEQVLIKMKSKIYRWRGEWKERGVGELRLMQHKKTGFIRALVRAQKTHKCIVNHLLQQKDIFCKLEPMKTSNNAWTWAAYDISDQKPQSEKLCAKFTSKDDFEKFQKEFNSSCLHNQKIFEAGHAHENKHEENKQVKPQEIKVTKVQSKGEQTKIQTHGQGQVTESKPVATKQ